MVSPFLLLGCNLSYIVDLFAALHELASASALTLLKLASSVRALLKPFGDTLKHVCDEFNADLRSLQKKNEICVKRDVVVEVPTLSHNAQHCHRVHVTSVDVLFCPFQGGFRSPFRS